MYRTFLIDFPDFREVEREVVVVSGTYYHTPMPGYEDHYYDAVQIYGSTPRKDPRIGGGGEETFADFLHKLSGYIGSHIVGEVANAPVKITYLFGPRPRNAEGRSMLRLPEEEVQLVLKHVSEQTGLTFRHEKRKVQILFVELDSSE